ncbi:MAG TPA: hypothetical protein VGH94_07530 [Acidimicrobiales bacterium]|jgi:hypothetical protein
MSAGPATISMQPDPLVLSRAYDELVDGLTRLAESVRRGDLARVVAPRPAPFVVPTWTVPTAVPDVRAARRAEHLFKSVAVEAVKTGLVALVLYQGLIMVLPAPDRPRFAPPPTGASPAAAAHLPNVAPAARAAASGRHTEVEVDGDRRSQLTVLP